MVRLRGSVAQVLQIIPVTLGLLALPVLSPIMLLPAAQAQTAASRVLSVSGSGVETIPTTLAQINLGVEVKGPSAEQVQAEVARKSSAVMELLKSRNVDELQTRGIRLNPTYNYANNEQTLTGYVGTNTVSFQIDTPKAGDLLDDAVTAGATRIDGISFTATDAAIAAAQKVALKKATEDAQAQAKSVLDALGFQAQEIVGIQVNNAAPPTPIMFQAAEAAPRVAKASTPVVGGDQDVAGNVTLQIRY